jgi:hypothetical protein
MNANGYSASQQVYAAPIYPSTAGQMIPVQSKSNYPGTRMASYPGMTSNGLHDHPEVETSSSGPSEIGISNDDIPSSSYGVSFAHGYQSSITSGYYQQFPANASSTVGQWRENSAFNSDSSEQYNYSTAYGQAT